MMKSDLHVHTCYCDGTGTPEEMVCAAIERGMETIGFAGHAWVDFDPACAMTPEQTLAYHAEILRLREKYGDQIYILAGLEQDYYAALPNARFDYLIGSVHYLYLDGEYAAVDLDLESFCDLAQKHFDGSYIRLARRYYELVADLPNRTGCDIIGHFDLITKFNAGGVLFDENNPQYMRAAQDALDALLDRDMIFEINTGAVVRGYRRAPYPAAWMLHRIAQRRGRVILSSDAHSPTALLGGFENAVRLARAAGLGAITVMTREGWKNRSL